VTVETSGCSPSRRGPRSESCIWMCPRSSQ
jgi:hypothetical protein